MIRPDDQARWRPWLLPGERLLWAGRPKLGLALCWADLYLIPLSLAWGAVTVGTQIGFGAESGPLASALWIAAMALIGLYIFPGRFLLDALLRARLFYAVTDRRILLLRRGRFGGLRSIEIEYLPMLELRERSGGRGTILFDPGPDFAGWGAAGASLSPALGEGLRFYRIEQPRLVYEIVRREAGRRRREIAGEPPAHRAFIG